MKLKKLICSKFLFLVPLCLLAGIFLAAPSYSIEYEANDGFTSGVPVKEYGADGEGHDGPVADAVPASRSETELESIRQIIESVDAMVESSRAAELEPAEAAVTEDGEVTSGVVLRLPAVLGFLFMAGCVILCAAIAGKYGRERKKG